MVADGGRNEWINEWDDDDDDDDDNDNYDYDDDVDEDITHHTWRGP